MSRLALADHAGNLAILLIWAGRVDMAITMLKFRGMIMFPLPSDPKLDHYAIEQVEREMQEVRVRFETGKYVRN